MSPNKRMFAAYRLAVVVLAIGVSASIANAASPIQWNSGTAETLAKTPAELDASLTTLAARSDARHLVVQFSAPLTTEQRGALEATGLAEELRGEELFTVLAPLDAAFDAFVREEVKAVSDPDRRGRLRNYLEGFLLRGLRLKEDLLEQSSLEAMSGRILPIEVINGKLRIAGARILFGDQSARNGVVHIVNPAWLPEDE